MKYTVLLLVLSFFAMAATCEKKSEAKPSVQEDMMTQDEGVPLVDESISEEPEVVEPELNEENSSGDEDVEPEEEPEG